MLELRNFLASDAFSVVENANDPEVARFLGEVFPSPYTIENAKWWVTEGHQSGNVCNRAIVFENKCTGSIGATFFEAEHRYTAEIGYWLGAQYWGKGIVTEAINIFTAHIFASFDIQRIYAPVAHKNIASMRALEKNGYVCEGVFKKNMFLRGNMYDEHIYAKYS